MTEKKSPAKPKLAVCPGEDSDDALTFLQDKVNRLQCLAACVDLHKKNPELYSEIATLADQMKELEKGLEMLAEACVNVGTKLEGMVGKKPKFDSLMTTPVHPLSSCVRNVVFKLEKLLVRLSRRKVTRGNPDLLYHQIHDAYVDAHEYLQEPWGPISAEALEARLASVPGMLDKLDEWNSEYDLVEKALDKMDVDPDKAGEKPADKHSNK